MNSELVGKIIAVIIIGIAILIVVMGIRGIPFMRNRRGTRIKPDQMPRRTALLLNLMIASVMIIFALAVFFPVILRYSIFIMMGAIGLFLIILVTKKNKRAAIRNNKQRGGEREPIAQFCKEAIKTVASFYFIQRKENNHEV